MQTLHPDGLSPPRGSWRGAVRMTSLPLGGVGGGCPDGFPPSWGSWRGLFGID